MSTRRSLKRKEKPPFERFKDHIRHFTAFMFSNVGIILLVTFYTIGGAFIFPAIEITEYERMKAANPENYVDRNITARTLERIFDITTNYISFDRNDYKRMVNEALLDFQREMVKKHIDFEDIEQKWSFSGAFLYSLTVITTIGYGNITPKSDWGKLMTILYAIIGMPLFLLYLSNIGDVLAKSFKWIYSKVCLCRICPGVARRRIIREHRKSRQIAMSLALNNMESGRHSKYSQSSSNSSSDSSSGSGYSEETKSSSQTTSSVLDVLEEEEDSEIEREILATSSAEITVPLTVCITIMISYILFGASLFSNWEHWNYMDGSYFCFISLSSIGFGDLVPGKETMKTDKEEVGASFILCAVYLLLGMALIAMCFNLMQEQVIHNIRAYKRAFKACFGCRR